MNDRTQLGQPRPAAAPAPGKRFRIEKLEERIAPKGQPGTKDCWTTIGNPRVTARCS